MIQQIKIAVRSLLKSPTFTIVAVAVLALAIGAGTTIFSVVDAVVLRGLPFDEHDRIAALLSVDTKRPTTFGGGSSTTQNYVDWQKMQQSFEAIGLVSGASYRLKTENGEPADVRGQRVTKEFFPVLRVHPFMGRAFEDSDEAAGARHVFIISYGFWQSHFGGAPDVVGKTMDMNEEPWEVVGVMPRGFQYPVGSERPSEIYVPQIFTPEDINRGGSHNYNAIVIGRLKPGITLKQANDDMNRVTALLDEQYPKWEPGRRANVVTLHEFLVGKVRDWMLMLLGAVALVLLIACANVANLMLARATVRARETAIRTALGASRWALVRDLVLEGLLLSSTGAVLGVLLAYGGVRVLHVWLPSGLPRVATIGIDWRVLAFAVGSALVTGVIFGVVPAVRSARHDVIVGMKDGGRSSTTGVAGQRLTSALVVVEIALAVILVVGAGLFITSFADLVRIDPGFDYHNILTLSVGLRVNFQNRAAFDEALKHGAEYVQQMTDAIRRIPGVEMVGAVSGGVPLTGSWSRNSITIAGGPELNGDDSIDIRSVSVNYLSVLKVPILRGRGLTDEDAKPGASSVVVINQAAVQKYWPGQDPLGAHVKINNKDRTVVGIVANVRHLGPESPFRQEAYYPIALEGTTGASLVIRTKSAPLELLPSVKAAIWSVNPDQHLTGDVVTLEGYMDRLIAERRFTMALLGIFGLLGLTIAAAGIYGLMAYVVAQRTNEIGVRMALGATPVRMLSMVLRRAIMLTVSGLVIGGGAAWYLSSNVQKFLFQVKPTDPIVFAGALITLLVTALLASAIPARRAAAVDPLVSLRHE